MQKTKMTWQQEAISRFRSAYLKRRGPFKFEALCRTASIVTLTSLRSMSAVIVALTTAGWIQIACTHTLVSNSSGRRGMKWCADSVLLVNKRGRKILIRYTTVTSKRRSRDACSSTMLGGLRIIGKRRSMTAGSGSLTQTKKHGR